MTIIGKFYRKKGVLQRGHKIGLINVKVFIVKCHYKIKWVLPTFMMFNIMALHPIMVLGGLLFGGPRTDFKLKNGSLEVFERCFEYFTEIFKRFLSVWSNVNTAIC